LKNPWWQFAVQTDTMNYEQAFLAQLEVYSKLFGERWVIDLCHKFTMGCLRQPEIKPEPLPSSIETDSLDDFLPSSIPIVEEAVVIPSPPPSPPPEPEPERKVKILRMKKSPPLVAPTPSSPEAKQNLAETVKKTVTSKKKTTLRDMDKLVKCGLLPPGSKVVPSAPEIAPNIYGVIHVNAKGKAGIQPSWNTETMYVGKSNAPTQFLAAVNKQFPSYKVYGRENAWNDLLKVNPSGGYVSLADLWIQSR
jgi:hypothetical protein